jgi:glycosyltransferase involved in cell wall biosynthesis
MRLALVVYGSLAEVSGGFIYDRALAGALGELGHRLDVIGLPWTGYARAVAGSLAGRPTVGDTGDYDAILEDELIHPSVFARATAARRSAGAPLRIALVHNLRSAQPGQALPALARAIERRYLATVDGAIAVCQQTRAGLHALAGAALPSMVAYPGRDHVAPAVEPAWIDARGAQGGPLRVLHVATGLPHKGLHRLLEALARAAAPTRGGGAGLDFTLDVVGRPPPPRYARALQRQMARPALRGRIRQHGERRGAELAAIYRRSHLLALPSDREAYSLACLEALGFGLPVLATSSGGLPEMLTEGREGHLIDPDDLDGWASALRRLGADRAALRAMGRAALARYQRHATWRQVALGVQEFLEAQRRALPGAPGAGARAV